MRIAVFSFILLCFSLPGLSSEQQPYCVRTPGAKLWQKPAYKSKSLWKVVRFTPLLGTGKKKGPFLEVTNVDGNKFWIQKKDVSTKMSCLAVKTKKAALRKGPGESFELAEKKTAEKHEAFRDLGGEDGWTLVQNEEGEVSWVELSKTWKPKSRIRISFEDE